MANNPMIGSYVFSDEFGSGAGYDGNGNSIAVKVLDDTDGVEVAFVNSSGDTVGVVFLGRKTLPKVARAFEICSTELVERVLDRLTEGGRNGIR